jgi:hypothetical protein
MVPGFENGLSHSGMDFLLDTFYRRIDGAFVPDGVWAVVGTLLLKSTWGVEFTGLKNGQL